MKSEGQKNSLKHENRLADLLDGRRVSGSGSSWSHKGDVQSADLLVEHKYTSRKSYSIKSDVWRKIEKEAAIIGRVPVLAVRLELAQLDLIVLSEDDFVELRERAQRAQSED